MFCFKMSSLHDLLKNYMPISSLINDVVLATMDRRELKIYQCFLEGGTLLALLKSRGVIEEKTALTIITVIIKALD